MPDELSNLNEDDQSNDEQLKTENDFLKMKIMLEHGGQFGVNEKSDMPLPPEIENQFLNNILAFEQQYGTRKSVKIFDKIGKPQHFKPVAEIADEGIDEAWHELKGYMKQHSVVLDVCSPNVSARELYRFATEEFFEHETDDIDLPGWSSNFIYDEFHPDPVYDTLNVVENNLFHDIFKNTADPYSKIYYANDGFLFNNMLYDSFDTLNEKINRFKSLFDEIEMSEFVVTNHVVNKPDARLEGNYRATARLGADVTTFQGDFAVKLLTCPDQSWEMKEIRIDGFNVD